MSIIDMTKALARALQQDERYLNFIAARDKNDEDAERIELANKRVGYLSREALLELRPARKTVDATRDLGKARHAAVARDIAHVRTAHERQQVMLAHRRERDVADNDHLLVSVLMELFAQI